MSASNTATEYLDSVIAELEALKILEGARREQTDETDCQQLLPLVSIVLTAVLRRFPLVERAGIMELTKIKMTNSKG